MSSESVHFSKDTFSYQASIANHGSSSSSSINNNQGKDDDDDDDGTREYYHSRWLYWQMFIVCICW